MDDIKEQEAEMAMERWLEDVGENLELVLDRYHENIIAMLVEEGYDVNLRIYDRDCENCAYYKYCNSSILIDGGEINILYCSYFNREREEK